MVTAAQEALFAEFGNEAQWYKPLSDIIPKDDYGGKAFKISYQNGYVSVDVGYASDFQIRDFVKKANEMGLGFQVEGHRGNLRIESISAANVQPEFFEQFSIRKANQSPAAQAYRAERQLDGQEPASSEAANDAIKSMRERNADFEGRQTNSVRIGPSHVDEKGVVHGVLQTEVTAKQISTSGGRVQVSHSSAVTLTVNIPFTVTPVGGSYELKVETPSEVGGRRNGLPVPQEHMHGAEVAAQRTLGEMFGNGVKQGKTFVTPQMLNEAHGKRVEVARAADRVVMNTLEQVFAYSVPEAPAVEAPAPVTPPAVEEVRDVAKPAPQEAPAAAPIAAEAEPQRAPAQLGRADGPGLGQGMTLGESSSGVSVPSLGTVNANPAADITEDFWKSLIPKDPDPIHLPLSGLSPKELEDLRRNLENTSSDVPSSERGAVIDAYRSLQFSAASKQALDEIQVRLNDNIRNALESDPELQRATREWSGMSIEEKIKALKAVETAVGAAYGHNPSISYFDLAGLTSGENVAGRIAVNLHEKSLDAAIETIAHESHHTFQRDIAENINHLPDERLRSAAEIYKLNFSLVRKGAIGSNGDSFAYVYEPIESDARRAGYGARDVVAAHIKNASVPDKVASHKSNGADLESMLADYDRKQLLVEVPTSKGPTYGVILPDAEQATSLQRALIEKGVATEVFEHNNQRVVRIRTGSLDAFKALVPPSVDLGDVDKLTLGHSTEVKSSVASESQPPVATATTRHRPPLERRMMGLDGTPIDHDMEARLAQRQAERAAAAATPPTAEAPKPVVAEPAPAAAATPEVKPAETVHAPAAEPVAAPHGVERVGKGAGVGLGAMGLAGRVGGSLSTAAKVGGDQLKSEVAAAGADATAIATDLADMARSAGKVAKFIGKASPIVAAGGAVLEVNAANHAQDGRRGAGAITGFVGGMASGAGTGALAGTMGAGPVGTVVGGIGGAVVGGYLSSEAGQRSQWGDQRQRDLDHQAQHRMDQDTEKLQQLAKKDPQKWTEAEKASVREIGEHMRQHVERMGALQLPETDVDGRLRQEAQKKQAMEAVEYLNGSKPASTLKTSVEKAEVAAKSIDALLPQLNDPKLGWVGHLDADKDGKVSRADVLATLAKHGLDVHTLDKDGNGLTGKELTDALKAAGADKGMVRVGRSVSAPETAVIADEVHSNFTGRDGQKNFLKATEATLAELEKKGLGAQIGNGDAKITLDEIAEVFKKNGIRASEVDRNGDGKVSAEEMTKALQAHGISAPAATPVAAKTNGTAASRG